MLKKAILNFKNETYEKRMFVLILMLATIPLLIMGVITYFIYINGEVKRNKEKLDSYSEVVSQDYENICSSIREYYMDISQDEDFKWLVNQTEPPYTNPTQVSRIQNLLHGNSFMMNYISHYNFVNVKEGWVLNNYGMSTYDELRNKADIDAFVKEQEKRQQAVYWLNRKEIISPYEEIGKISRIVDTSEALFVIKKDDKDGNVMYLLLIRLNQSKLDEIAHNYQKLGYEVTILSDGKVLTQSSQDFTDAYISGNRGREQYDINVTQSGLNNLTCVVGYDLSSTKNRGAVFVFASIAFAGAVAMLIILIRYASVVLSKPVIQLQKLVDNQSNQIRELFVSHMIKGELSEKKMKDALNRMKTPEYPYYRLLAVVCKAMKSGEEVQEVTRLEWQAKIVKDQPEELRRQLFVEPVIYRNAMIFIVGDDNDIALDRKTALVYKLIKDYIAETCDCTISSGVSRSFSNLIQLTRAYDECSEALHHKQNQDTSFSSLVLYDDYSLKDHILNPYDIVVENELIHAIAGANEEEANRLLELILERMERRNVSGIERNFYVTRLLTAIIAVPDNASIPLTEIFDSEQYNVINQTSQIYDRDQLVAYIETKIIHPITVALNSKSQSGGSEIAKQVIRMIKDSKGNLSLNECAESLSYHPNYIWKVLKKETGQNFTDMVTSEKLELAKFMLLTTDYSIAEISEKLQYNNVQNFIRFFKTNTETTPASYRKAHKH